MITGPTDESPTIIRADGRLGGLEVVPEGLLDDGYVDTASYAVGDALVSLPATEFDHALRALDGDWIYVQQRHARIEFRFRADD